MGTRSRTIIRDNIINPALAKKDEAELGGDVLVVIYRQFDGYPTGMGIDIKTALNGGDVEILNGISSGQGIPEYFNGMGCLAAYLVGWLKRDAIGDVYLESIHGCPSQEYNYTVYCVDRVLHILCEHGSAVIYDGTLKDFNPEEVERADRG